MSDSRKDNFTTWTNDPGLAARYAPIHGMVTDVLARVDPDGYAESLEILIAENKPQSIAEKHVLALLADLAWRIQGCFYLETEILRRGMEEGGPKDDPGLAMARVFMRETGGGGLLTKLAKYKSRLETEESRCFRTMQLQAKNRKYKEARMAQALARHKPCTSVIQ
jgi:hypothetical protein